MKKYLIILLIAFSCTPYRYLDKHHKEICDKCISELIRHDSISIDTLIQYRDVYIPLANDSIWQDVYFKCDSNNQVLMLKVIDGKKSEKLINDFTFNNNVLRVKSKLLQDSILVLNKIIKERKTEYIQIPPVEIPVDKNKWIYLIVIFGLLISLILALILKK